MKTYANLETARYGLYVSAWPPDVCFVGATGEPIEGRSGARYARIPAPLLAVVGPMLGGVFVMAFPVIIALAPVIGLAAIAIGKVRSAAERHAYLVRVGWEPAAAYLNRDASKAPPVAPTSGPEPNESDELSALEAEARARRESERKES